MAFLFQPSFKFPAGFLDYFCYPNTLTTSNWLFDTLKILIQGFDALPMHVHRKDSQQNK